MVSILVVDQDDSYCSFQREHLPLMGYIPNCVKSVAAAIQEVISGQYKAAILEVEYENCDGFQVLEKLRRESDLPVVFLAKKSEPDFRATGLELGADDFISKDWPLRELVARLGAILRRAGKHCDSQDEKVVVNNLELDLRNRTTLYEGRAIELTQIEFTILHHLARTPNKVINRLELSRRALGRDLTPFDRSIDVHVCHLRQKLSLAGHPHKIKTIRGFGYIYAA